MTTGLDWREAWALSPTRWPIFGTPGPRPASRAGQLSRLRLRDPLANHLGQKQLRDRPRPLEPCWYVVRKGSTASWVGDHSQTTLWQIDKNLKSETGHGTQKPVECMPRPGENNASPGQAVYEPFSGALMTVIE